MLPRRPCADWWGIVYGKCTESLYMACDMGWAIGLPLEISFNALSNQHTCIQPRASSWHAARRSLLHKPGWKYERHNWKGIYDKIQLELGAMQYQTSYAVVFYQWARWPILISEVPAAVSTSGWTARDGTRRWNCSYMTCSYFEFCNKSSIFFFCQLA